ncbi:MAG: class I SAM-dependent methyltransferase [Pseudomonadota bacterium]
MTLTEADTAWGEHFEPPPNLNMAKNKPREVFVRNGTVIFKEIEAAIEQYLPGREIGNLDILDFGCGVGRVAMPFYYKYKKPTVCVDLVKVYIDYLQRVIPGAQPQMSTFQPPLPFADGSFDVIYSISVWTHLEPGSGAAWLDEVARLLRPGGVALISTSSYVQLERHRKHKERSKLWGDVTDDDLKSEGIIFRGEQMDGMGGVYGCTVHEPAWVKEHWSKVMPVQETRVRAIGGAEGGAQDLNIMIKG